MELTIVAFLLVVLTQLITKLRLRKLKAKLDEIQPHIEKVRGNLHEAERDFELLKLKSSDSEVRLTHLKDAVRELEKRLREPKVVDPSADERARLSAEAASPIDLEG